jgi:hypothetical protein
VALPAVLELTKLRVLLLMKVGANEELLIMPGPLIVNTPLPVKVYAGAPALNRIELIPEVPIPMEVIFDAPKLAVPLGTVGGFQFEPVFQSPDAGINSQVASCAFDFQAQQPATTAMAAADMSGCKTLFPSASAAYS